MSRLPGLIAPLLLATLLAPATAAPPTLSAELVGVGGTGRLLVEVEGPAGDGCAPELVDFVRHGVELVLRARPHSGRCPPQAQAQPWRLSSRTLERPLLIDRPGVYRLRFELQADPASTPQLEAFRLLEVGAPPRPVQPEAGFWWGEQGAEFDRAGPGFGVQLEHQSGTTALAVSGYDDDGQPHWLFGAAPVTGSTVSIPLGRLQGGRGPYGRFHSPEAIAEAGKVHVEWLGSARAVFWFERPALDGRGIELQPISMVRFGFAGGDHRQWLGRWLLAADGHAGDAVVPTRSLDFVRLEPDPDGFALWTEQGERLRCRLDAERPASPPGDCRLLLDPTLSIDFDDVGLTRMQGQLDGAQAQLVRLGAAER